MMALTPVQLAYFGKLPSRGDFVRSDAQPALIRTLDQWLTQTMDALAADAGWREAFDNAQALHFAFIGPKRRMALAGHLLCSRDASGRRFPFVTAGAFEVAQPAAFTALSPLALKQLWARLGTSARLALAAAELAEAQPQLEADDVAVLTEPAAHAAPWQDFLGEQTLASLQAALAGLGAAAPPSTSPLRTCLLALGLLLQPVVVQGVGQLGKALLLPLPTDPALRAPAAALWMHLVTGFVARWDAELALFFTTRGTQACMAVGFRGASPALLGALLHPALDQSLVDLTAPESLESWVESSIRGGPHGQADYGLRKLGSYLADPQLSLQQAVTTFQEVFLGM